MNKKVLTLIVFILVGFSGSLWWKLGKVSSEITALKLKINLSQKLKVNKPISWSETISKTKESKKNLPEKIESTLTNIKKSELEKIEESIRDADELIVDEPYSYSSYKAKLILLLTKEAKFNKTIDDYELRVLLETMSLFDVLSDKVLRKEAFLISRTNKRIDEILDQEEISEDELSEVEVLEEQLENGFLDDEDFINEDLVEIPLLRGLARKDYDFVIEESEALLSEFPDSIRGNYFLIKALELAGETEQALDVLENLQLSDEKMKILKNRLQSSRNKKTEDYWKELRF